MGEREGYPDYKHSSGKRLELKLLYVDNPSLKMKKPPTPREPSARLTQKVTVKNVDPLLNYISPSVHQNIVLNDYDILTILRSLKTLKTILPHILQIDVRKVSEIKLFAE